MDLYLQRLDFLWFCAFFASSFNHFLSNIWQKMQKNWNKSSLTKQLFEPTTGEKTTNLNFQLLSKINNCCRSRLNWLTSNRDNKVDQMPSNNMRVENDSRSLDDTRSNKSKAWAFLGKRRKSKSAGEIGGGIEMIETIQA